MPLLRLAALAVVPCLAAMASIPLINSLAISRRLLDYPDDDRHTHQRPVPRLGGMAVFAGLLATAFAGVATTRPDAPVTPLPPHTLSLIAAGAILFAVGLLDDLRGVRPALKLVGQTAAALIVCQDGVVVTHLSFPPHLVVALGWLSVPVTVLWLVGVSNAFNLIDGLDGLAGGIGIIAAAAIAAAAVVLGNTTVPVYAVAIIGALLGFLRFNAPPARIFLGDSGSLVVGFLLAVLAVKGSTQHDGTLLTLMPIFALSYPLLDTGISILRRWLRGDPLSRADGRHIHHQLRALGLSPRKALAVIYLESASVAVLGLSVTFAPPAMTVAVAAAGGAVLLFIFVYGLRWLDYHEFAEARSMLATAAPRARTAIRDTIVARDLANAIAAAVSRDEIDTILADAAETFRFSHMQLGHSQEAPPLHLCADIAAVPLWKAEFPVVTADGESIADPRGRPVALTIWCATSSPSRHANVASIAQILAPAIAAWSESSTDTLLRRKARRRILSPVVAQRAVGWQSTPGFAADRALDPRTIPVS